MDIEERSFDELKKELLTKVIAGGCTIVTIKEYRYIYNSIIRIMKDAGNQYYTKEGGNKVLESYLQVRCSCTRKYDFCKIR